MARNRRLRTSAVVVAAACAASLGLALAVPAAHADPGYAPPAEATITPGVQMHTEGAQCTANFVFRDADGAHFIGYAAHCAGDGGAATDTNGCTAPTLLPGQEVEIGDDAVGTLAYSSWHTMQTVGETDPDTCLYNDFALVEIDPADVSELNPTVPHWGGPTGLDRDGVAGGETVHSYGNSSLRLGLTLLSPKTGVGLGTTGSGWSHQTYTVTPGIPGDSGSGLLDSEGRAAGVLSTLAIAPLPASNNYSDLARALEYANTRGGMDRVELVPGEVAFDGDQLPLGLGL